MLLGRIKRFLFAAVWHYSIDSCEITSLFDAAANSHSRCCTLLPISPFSAVYFIIRAARSLSHMPAIWRLIKNVSVQWWSLSSSRRVASTGRPAYPPNHKFTVFATRTATTKISHFADKFGPRPEALLPLHSLRKLNKSVKAWPSLGHLEPGGRPAKPKKSYRSALYGRCESASVAMRSCWDWLRQVIEALCDFLRRFW